MDRNPISSQDVSTVKYSNLIFLCRNIKYISLTITFLHFSNPRKVTLKCKIYDWTNEEEEVIAEGLVCSFNSKEMVNNIGPNAVRTEVVNVFNDNAHLWRQTANMFLIGDAINEKIAWTVLKFEVMDTTTTDATPTITAAKKKASPSKSAKKKAVVCY